jgi:hypothetical protein
VWNGEVTDEIGWPGPDDDGNPQAPSCNDVKNAIKSLGTGTLACERASDEVDEVAYLITFDSAYFAPESDTVDVTAEVGRALMLPVVT